MSDSEVAKSHFKMAFNGILVAVRVPSFLVENRPLFEKLLIMEMPGRPFSLIHSFNLFGGLKVASLSLISKKSKLFESLNIL